MNRSKEQVKEFALKAGKLNSIFEKIDFNRREQSLLNSKLSALNSNGEKISFTVYPKEARIYVSGSYGYSIPDNHSAKMHELCLEYLQKNYISEVESEIDQITQKLQDDFRSLNL